MCEFIDEVFWYQGLFITEFQYLTQGLGLKQHNIIVLQCVFRNCEVCLNGIGCQREGQIPVFCQYISVISLKQDT